MVFSTPRRWAHKILGAGCAVCSLLCAVPSTKTLHLLLLGTDETVTNHGVLPAAAPLPYGLRLTPLTLLFHFHYQENPVLIKQNICPQNTVFLHAVMVCAHTTRVLLVTPSQLNTQLTTFCTCYLFYLYSININAAACVQGGKEGTQEHGEGRRLLLYKAVWWVMCRNGATIGGTLVVSMALRSLFSPPVCGVCLTQGRTVVQCYFGTTEMLQGCLQLFSTHRWW